MSREKYGTDPCILAATLAARANSDYTWGLLIDSGSTSSSMLSVKVPLEGNDTLFCLLKRRDGYDLSSPVGETELTLEQVEQAEPDPLWEDAVGICRHMEDDHADTFPVFLNSVGVEEPGESIRMPWVERSGFFLACQGTPHWVPFEQDCPTSKDVRTTLVKTLRRLREDSSS